MRSRMREFQRSQIRHVADRAIILLSLIVVLSSSFVANIWAQSSGQNPQAVRPVSPGAYCSTSSKVIEGPASAPAGFLYLPFSGSLTSNNWTSQMDHQSPDYSIDGVVATLGESISYSRVDAQLAAGTRAY